MEREGAEKRQRKGGGEQVEGGTENMDGRKHRERGREEGRERRDATLGSVRFVNLHSRSIWKVREREGERGGGGEVERILRVAYARIFATRPATCIG